MLSPSRNNTRGNCAGAVASPRVIMIRASDLVTPQEYDDISIVSQMTIDRLSVLISMAQSWEGRTL